MRSTRDRSSIKRDGLNTLISWTRDTMGIHITVFLLTTCICFLTVTLPAKTEFLSNSSASYFACLHVERFVEIAGAVQFIPNHTSVESCIDTCQGERVGGYVAIWGSKCSCVADSVMELLLRNASASAYNPREVNYMDLLSTHCYDEHNISCLANPKQVCGGWSGMMCLDGSGYCNESAVCYDSTNCSAFCQPGYFYERGECYDCRSKEPVSGVHYWGVDCSWPCPAGCDTGCHPAHGTCDKQCENGLTPPYCGDSCPVGTWGIMCRKECPACKDGVCDRESGRCLNGCQYPNVGGLYCNECVFPKYFGERCELRCPYRCWQGLCVNPLGRCLLGCDGGFYGPTCERQCPHTCLGWYPNKPCDQFTGACKYGCVRRNYGPRCENRCPDMCDECDRDTSECTSCADWRRIGPLCNDRCPNNCDNRCNMSGVCTDCPIFRHGLYCEHPCPENCLSNRCERFTGRCDMCRSGYWGEQCERDCENCLGRCNRVTGVCELCGKGLYGSKCEQLCPRNCLDGRCHIRNATCTDGCRSARYFGANCSDTCQCDACTASGECIVGAAQLGLVGELDEGGTAAVGAVTGAVLLALIAFLMVQRNRLKSDEKGSEHLIKEGNPAEKEVDAEEKESDPEEEEGEPQQRNIFARAFLWLRLRWSGQLYLQGQRAQHTDSQSTVL